MEGDGARPHQVLNQPHEEGDADQVDYQSHPDAPVERPEEGPGVVDRHLGLGGNHHAKAGAEERVAEGDSRLPSGSRDGEGPCTHGTLIHCVVPNYDVDQGCHSKGDADKVKVSRVDSRVVVEWREADELRPVGE